MDWKKRNEQFEEAVVQYGWDIVLQKLTPLDGAIATWVHKTQNGLTFALMQIALDINYGRGKETLFSSKMRKRQAQVIVINVESGSANMTCFPTLTIGISLQQKKRSVSLSALRLTPIIHRHQ